MFRKNLEELLKKKYSPAGIEEQAERKLLYKKLIQLTPNKTLSELTTTPLLARPPVGFQKLQIEFSLRKTSVEDKNLNFFLNHLHKYPKTFDLKKMIRASKEAYQLAKCNNDPSKPIELKLAATQKTCLYELAEKKWEVLRVYDKDKVPRAYVAIQPKCDDQKRKILIVFMGAEVFPKPLESWWTNNREKQIPIWRDVNFFRSATEHTGIKQYALHFFIRLEKLLKDINFENPPHFELLGHSTGGVLAITTARYLRQTHPGSRISAVTFATPNFMTKHECEQLVKECLNNQDYSIFNLMDYLDPAIGIYGERLHQPSHTVFYASKDFRGYSFIDVHAASAGSTLIKNHLPAHYEEIVDQLTVAPLRSKL